MKSIKAGSLQFNPIELLFALVPIWWILGVDLFIYFCFSIFLFKRKYMFLSPTSRTMLLLILILAYYLIIRTSIYMSTTSEIGRSLSSFYNSALILSGCLYLASSVNSFTSFEDKTNPYLNGYSYIFLTSFPVAVLAYLFSIGDSSNDLYFQTFIGKLYSGNLPGVWDSAKEAIIYRPEWGTGESTPRLTLFSQFPTSASLVFAISGYIFLVKSNLSLRNSSFVYIGILFMVLFTQTRTVLGGVLISIPIAYLLFYFDRKTILTVFFAIFLVMCISILILLMSGFSLDSGYRLNSIISRFSNYFFAVNLVSKENLIFGLGIKPFNPDFFKFPIGSHSTPISQLTKGGVVSLILTIFIFYFYPLLTWIKIISDVRNIENAINKKLRITGFYIFQGQIVLWIWLLFEDFDAIPLSSVTVFLFLALVFNYKSCIDKEKQKNYVY